MPSVPPRLEKENCALVVIDMQERFRDQISAMAQIRTSCARLIRFCQRLEIPILVTEHYPRGLGATLIELRECLKGFEPLEKITFSCAGDPGFNAHLKALGRDQLILCGIETHVCVYQTARDLLEKAHQVAVAADAVGSRSVQDRALGLQRMAQLGVQMMSTEMIMFEILRRARTEDFKLVADILKQ